MSTQRNPTWILVSSSAIEALAYAPETEELFIRFKPSGTEYVYEHVTASEHTALTTAGSLGQCFNVTIKPHKQFHKLGGTP